MKTHVTKQVNCPACGHLFDRMSGPFNDAAPRSGDISVCIKCQNILEVQADSSLRQLSDMAILSLHPDTQRELYQVIAAMERSKKHG